MSPDTLASNGPFGTIPYAGAWGVSPRLTADLDRLFQTQLTIRQPGYGQLRLEWVTPGGEWDGLAVVRNSWGTPISKDGGVTVLEWWEANGTPVFNSYLDTRLPQGDFYHYGVFVHTTDDIPRWVRAAGGSELVVKDHGSADLLYNSLPAMYRVADTTGYLRSFLRLFAFELDLTRTLIDTVQSANNLQRVSAKLLPSIAQQMNAPYEPAVGEHRMRLLLSSLMLLRKMKGTADGLAAFIEVLTGYEASVLVGKNILLDRADSDFRGGSVGNWSCFGSADDLYWSDAVPGGKGGSSTGYLVVRSEPVGGYSLLALVYSTTSSLVNYVLGVDRTIGRSGIPVTPGADYTISTYVRAADASREFRAVLIWADAEGVTLPIDEDPTPSGQGTPPDTDWDTRVWATGTAPAEAQYLYPVFASVDPSEGSAGDEFYFDQIQVELGTEPSSFEPARQLHLYLSPTRENLVENPSFEVDDTGWSGYGADITVIDTDAHSGVQCAEVEVTAVSGPGVIVSAPIPVEEGLPYVATAFAQEVTSLGVLQLVLTFSDEDDIVVDSYSSTAQGVLGSWRKLALEAEAPAGATTVAVAVGYAESTGLTGNLLRVDSVLVEQAYQAGHYFDGDSPTTSDEYGWQGTPHGSTSFYYRNRSARAAVLERSVDSWIPADSAYELIYWRYPD